MKTVVVIPARYAATRLPGKLLRQINGKKLLIHTVERAISSNFPVYVAYDDLRIAKALRDVNVSLIATSAAHENGTSRLCEAAIKMAWSDDTIVVNVQGDEPLLPAKLIVDVANLLQKDAAADVATLAVICNEINLLNSINSVKVVCDCRGHALYFSRHPIPCVRDDDCDFQHLHHVGIYAYRVATLKKYSLLKSMPLERAEKLEQLRFIENGIKIAVGLTAAMPPSGVDSEEDIKRVENLLRDGFVK